MAAGKIKWFNETKGYGFIESDDGAEVFVHHSGVAGKRKGELQTGTRVTFQEIEGQRGPKAVDVRVVH
jgi:CspA family cold shock protein